MKTLRFGYKNDRDPLISVIICNYNSEKYLGRCLNSIKNSTYKKIEVVLINDNSQGDDSNIVNFYRESINIVYKKNQANCGLLKSRLIGVSHSTGEYVTFIDADDEISIDFLRNNIFDAVEKKCDLLRCHLSIRTTKATFKFIRNHITQKDLNLNGNSLEFLLKQEGRDWTLHTVCGAIYKRELLEKVLFLINSLNYKVSMCEDVLLSILLYYFSRRTCSSSHLNDVYYYWKHEFNMTNNSKSAYESINSINYVKNYLISFLKKYNLDEFSSHIENWLEAYKFMWKERIGELRKEDLGKTKEGQNILSILNESTFFTVNVPYDYSKTDNIKKLIANPNIEVVSFDLFDTLLKRRVLSPTDLFTLLEKEVIKSLKLNDLINFKEIRIEAEKRCRLKRTKEDISIDDIYEELNKILCLGPVELERIKEAEIRLEIKLNSPRKFVQELLNLANYFHKKVLVISDMYLPDEVIRKIIKLNSLEVSELYVSSNIGKSKSTGNLFKAVGEINNIKFKNWVHIGDNLMSDYLIPRKLGITSVYLPSVKKCLEDNKFCRDFSMDSIEKSHKEIGLSFVFANIANNIFDDPFVNENPNTFFKSPANVGIFPLACHLISLAYWLNNELNKQKIDTIHFLARDGYLLKRVFDLLFNKDHVKTFYTYLNRKTLLPLQIDSYKDLLLLLTLVNYKEVSTLQIYSIIENLLDFKDYESYCAFLKNTNFFNKNFTNIFEFKLFLDEVVKPNLNFNKINEYKISVITQLKKQISPKTAIFDIGYSCRTETCLRNLFKDIDFISFSVGLLPPNSLLRSNYFGIQTQTFFNQSIPLSGGMRELLLSSSEERVEGLNTSSNQTTVPIFAHNTRSYKEKYILNMIEYNLLTSVEELIYFKNELLFFSGDLNSIFENWLKYPTKDSLELFSNIKFDDKQLNRWDAKKISDIWLHSTAVFNSSNKRPLSFSSYRNYPKWKKVCLMFFFDRELFKLKVANKLKKYPKIYQVSKIICKTMLR